MALDAIVPGLIVPDWPAPAHVHAAMTTRMGGVSLAPFASFNLASHVGDEAAAVFDNRQLLRQQLLRQQLPAEPLWLNQVHGAGVADSAAARCCEQPPVADAAVSFLPNEVRVVLTADCLPVLFCDEAGTVVAAAHAGWRGLAAGVLEATVRAMPVAPERILVWLGAAIGPDAFEVGPEVREIFMSQHALAGIAFRPALPGTLDGVPHKWLADIYSLARIRLASIGVERVYGGGLCTFTDANRFYSYRRDGQTGRMASLIWRDRA